MNELGLKEMWLMEEKKSFNGWNFSYLSGRWEEEKLPWSYKGRILKYLNVNDILLDMGTGGGEFVLSLGHSYINTTVTETWEPNVKICMEILEPLGITVKQVFDDKKLPFENNTFDIIINRHASYDVNEIKRILKENGIFITQQVGCKNNEVLSNFLIPNFVPKNSDLTLKNEVSKFQRKDFSVLYKEEYFPCLRFFDVGAIVYFAKIIEWEFPNFTVDKCFDQLLKLDEGLPAKGYVESIEHRFIIVAKNKK